MAMIWGIYDKQRREFREEEYSTKEEAIEQFSAYWKGIVFSDLQDTFDYEHHKQEHGITHELTEQEEDDILKEYLADWKDEDFMDWYEMEARKIEMA